MKTRIMRIQIKATRMPRFEKVKAKKEEQRTKGREGKGSQRREVKKRDFHRTKSQSDRIFQTNDGFPNP